MSYTPEAPPAKTTQTNITPPAPVNSQRKRRRRRSGVLHRTKRAFRRIRWGKVFLVIVAIAAVAVVTTLAIIVDSANRVQSSITSFQRVVSSLSTRQGTELTMLDFSRLDASVDELTDSLSGIRTRL